MDLFKHWSCVTKSLDAQHFEAVVVWLNGVVCHSNSDHLSEIDFNKFLKINRNEPYPNWILTYAFLALEHYGQTLFENGLLDGSQSKLLNTLNTIIFEVINRPLDQTFHSQVDKLCDSIDSAFSKLALASKNTELLHELSLTFQAVFMGLNLFYAEENLKLLSVDKPLAEQIKISCHDFLEVNQSRIESLHNELPVQTNHPDSIFLKTFVERQALAVLHNASNSIEFNVDELLNGFKSEATKLTELSHALEDHKDQSQQLIFQLKVLENFKLDFDKNHENLADFCEQNYQAMTWVLEANTQTRNCIRFQTRHEKETLEKLIDNALTHYYTILKENELAVKEKICKCLPQETLLTQALVFEDFKKGVLESEESSFALLKATMARHHDIINVIETFLSIATLNAHQCANINTLKQFNKQADVFLQQYDTRWTAFLNFLSYIFSGSKCKAGKQVDEIKKLQSEMLEIKAHYETSINKNKAGLQSTTNASEPIKSQLTNHLAEQSSQITGLQHEDSNMKHNRNAFFESLKDSVRHLPKHLEKSEATAAEKSLTYI